jgi:dipeptidyl aminopeptidase/acylaminoacyl peptidase
VGPQRNKKMRAVTLVLFAILAMTSSPPTQRPVTIDDLMRMRAMSDVRISPDGERVAYVVSEASFERNAYEPAIFVVPSASGPPVELTPSTRIFNRPLPAARLKWTPDGSALSFLAWVGERPQVMTLPIGGRTAKQVTSAPEGVTNYEWAPDGRAIAYLSAEPMSPDEERRRKDQTFVIQVDRQNRPPRLWLATLDDAPPRALTPPEHFVDGLTWAPDGRSLVYSAAPFSGFMAPYETSLYSISREGGTPRVLVERDGIDNAPQFSPDGRHVAFISTGGRKLLKAARGLSVISLSSDSVGTPRMLTGDTGTWVAEFTWAPDSKSILFTCTEGTFAMGERMFESPPARVWLENPRTPGTDGTRIEALTTGPSASFSPSISRDGRRFAYRSVEHGTTGDVHVLDLGAAGNKPRKITEINPQVRELALGKVEPIRWKSFDGMEIWGLLVTPPGYDGKQKLPTLVYSHGGPIGGFFYGIFPQFPHTVGQVEPYPVQAMASAGFAILLPMPRGGSGYGEKGFDLIVNSWGEGDYRDIMAGVDYLIARGIADPDRLGAMGASYGGFMTSWIVGQTARFKAASTGASVTDLASMYYISEGGDFMAEYFKAPWENPAGYAAHSPLTHAAKVTTPLLIQHGEVDPRVPVSQARALYRALKGHGKLVELDIYPRGGHVLYEPKMQREQMRRNLEWFTRWLK